MSWTPQLTLKFIDAFRNQRLLWDTKHSDYKHIFKKNEAWDSLAELMKIPRKDLEMKIHNLRSQFRREVKKEYLAQSNGDVRKTTWFAFEALKFLTNENWTASSDCNDSGTDTLVMGEGSIKNEVFIFEETEPEYSTLEPEENKKQTPELNRYLKRKWTTDSETDEDEFTIYGKYVASELRSLKDEYSMIMAKHYINTILTKARLGKYRQKDSNFRNSDNESP